MRVVTFNANGIRSATQKGFWEWFAGVDADLLCIQELKAQEKDLKVVCEYFHGYETVFHFARKPGYSGCAILSKQIPLSTRIGFGVEEFDAEGRYVQADFDNFVLVSAYFPSGSSGEERQEVKFRFLDDFSRHMQSLRSLGKEVIVCGDFNIAHQEIDIKNWKGNLKNSGFLPEERQWMTQRITTDGWVDVFRALDSRSEQYTWWSQRGRAREKNVGWRIDYQLATPGIAARAMKTRIFAEQKFSDHAPVIIDYDWS